MIKLIITKIDGYNYYLVDEENREYKINIEFYGLEDSPKEQDLIYMNEELLKEVNNNIVSFGPIEEIYGRKIESNNDKDLIYLNIKNKITYLKRFYG